MTRWKDIVGVLLALAFAAAPSACADFMDQGAFDEILRHYVDSKGFVDYAGLRENAQSALESYLERLADADLAGWPRKERLAFWINAYNARVLDLLAQHPEIKKVSQAFELFNKPFRVAGRRLSANDIEYRVLLDRKNPENGLGPVSGLSLEPPDPLIHFGLVCGAVGCPRLANFAYTSDNVERTLLDNAVSFVNSPDHVALTAGRLRLSSLFKWYAKDFERDGGVAAFISDRLDSDKQLDADALKDKLAHDFSRAEYTYDWTLNDQHNEVPVP